MRTSLLLICTCLAAVAVAGCLNVTAPERIQIGHRSHESDVDSTAIPPTHSHEEARRELAKAYRRIQELERENAHCREKLEDARRKTDDCERKYDRLKDRCDD